MITLIIKGSRSDALDAALKRSICLHHVILEDHVYEESRAEAFPASAKQILDWFCESYNTPPNNGDLLWYSDDR